MYIDIKFEVSNTKCAEVININLTSINVKEKGWLLNEKFLGYGLNVHRLMHSVKF